MSYEYRVTWRRTNDNRKRYRLYQTREAAESYAAILEDNPDPGWGLDGILKENLERVGEPTDIRLERRPVQEWADSVEWLGPAEEEKS